MEKTRCSKCKRMINIEEVRLVNHLTKKPMHEKLLVAKCYKCNHTIYGSNIEEMKR